MPTRTLTAAKRKWKTKRPGVRKCKGCDLLRIDKFGVRFCCLYGTPKIDASPHGVGCEKYKEATK